VPERRTGPTATTRRSADSAGGGAGRTRVLDP